MGCWMRRHPTPASLTSFAAPTLPLQGRVTSISIPRKGPRVAVVQHLAWHLSQVAQAGEHHGDVHLLADDVDRLAHAGFAHGGEAVEMGAPDQAAARAERERFDHVLAGADAAVEQHLAAVATALAISGSTRTVAGAPSSWRPP